MAQVRRTGLTNIRFIAEKLCKAVALSDPLIRRIYPDNTALHTALDAANIACQVLVAEANAQLPVGD